MSDLISSESTRVHRAGKGSLPGGHDNQRRVRRGPGTGSLGVAVVWVALALGACGDRHIVFCDVSASPEMGGCPVGGAAGIGGGGAGGTAGSAGNGGSPAFAGTGAGGSSGAAGLGGSPLLDASTGTGDAGLLDAGDPADAAPAP